MTDLPPVIRYRRTMHDEHSNTRLHMFYGLGIHRHPRTIHVKNYYLGPLWHSQPFRIGRPVILRIDCAVKYVQHGDHHANYQRLTHGKDNIYQARPVSSEKHPLPTQALPHASHADRTHIPSGYPATVASCTASPTAHNSPTGPRPHGIK